MTRYNKGNRDKNEKDILEFLRARNVSYTQMHEGDGFDLLVWIQPAEFWEVKNPAQAMGDQVLTRVEAEAQAYCMEVGIPYVVIHSVDEALTRINKYFDVQPYYCKAGKEKKK